MDIIKNENNEPNITDAHIVSETKNSDLPQTNTATQQATKKPEIPEDVQKWLDANANYYVLVPRTQLEAVKLKLTEANEEAEVLYNIAITIMDLFGVLDPKTKKVKAEIMSGEESFVGGMLSSLWDVVTLLTAIKMGIRKKDRDAAEEKLAKKFEFLKTLIPLVQKYGKR